MEDNGCSVNNASESPFFMSQLLSKLDSRDNVDFGREMKRQSKEENVENLLDWLHQEASLRSRGKIDVENDDNLERSQRVVHQSRTENHANATSVPDDETCPLGCTEKHLLPACPAYQSSTVSLRWDAVKKHQRCRKCGLRSHHTNDCKQVAANNNNIQGSNGKEENSVKTVTGLCPVQKIKIQDVNGEFIEILAMLDSGSNTTEESITKTLQVYTVGRPCGNAKTISRKRVEEYSHLKPVTDKLHLSGDPIAKRNCFGWYALGQFDSTMTTDDVPRVQSVNVGTVIDGRVQVKMPWKENGPPKQSNYDIALKRMYSSERTFKKRNCFDSVEEEVQKLVDQGFVTKVPQEEVDHNKQEWYLPLQAVFMPEKTTKGPNYINSLTDVLIAWRWDNVAYSGDIRKMFNQVMALLLEASKELQEHAYVDDIAGSKLQESEAKQVTKDIDTILAKGQFEIKAWHSNHKDIDQSDGEESVDLLGHRWDKKHDTFSFKKNEIVSRHEHLTKRNCLAILAQLWDPLGLVSPVTVKFRIDLQELWSSGFVWDEILPESVQQRWMESLKSMNDLLSFNFDRQLKPSNSLGAPEIHGFSDGGELAYGAVVFLRWKLVDGSYCCVPVMTKSFVAPLKKKSIPRLELLGCLALTRMYDTCTKALDFAKIVECRKFFWVDSSTVLSWVKTPPREFRPFVSARVAEIQETVCVEDFHYIRSKSNPADALTRGIKPEHLESWLNGPDFLLQPESQWPKHEEEPEHINNGFSETAETKRERKIPKQTERIAEDTKFAETYSATAAPNDERKDNPILSQLLESCSTFHKVRKTLAFLFRFVQKVSKKSTKKGPLAVQELKDAEQQLFKWCQHKLDVRSLDKSIVAQEDNEGIIRAHGRLEDVRTLPAEMRNPIILPRDHPLVRLLILHLHDKRSHCGYKSLVHEIRKRFWIVGVRSTAKQLTRRCVTCRRLRKKPLEQLMGQVPSLRVAAGCPIFTNTALDMFGPVQIRLNRKTLKEAQVIIFTCMTTRAVHLELVTDKSTNTFLMAFRRFASSRGHPSTCWSDCGSNFVGAQEYLEEIKQNWDFERIKNTLTHEFSCDLKWEWNVPTTSHQNGVVESLIKSVRQALSVTCKNQSFTEEQWRTFLTEVTYIVNGRPLYPSSESVWESPPITPNDILLGQHNSPPQPTLEDRVNPRDLMRSTQKRIAEFWECWMRYFAPNLLPRNKWYRTRENVQIGDLVLQIDPKHRRTQWKMALVVATYPAAVEQAQALRSHPNQVYKYLLRIQTMVLSVAVGVICTGPEMIPGSEMIPGPEMIPKVVKLAPK
ncbi:hypothetical protein QZH41_002643 [Actinostola sp. cb2023]|nr:hypothetical protein QZH41_002643 [Actinostola sp. cb2023]